MAKKEKKTISKKKATIIYSIVGSLLIAGGIGTGVVLYNFFGFNGTDYSSISADGIQMNKTALMQKYEKVSGKSLEQLSERFTIAELANIALANSEKQENMSIVATGEVTATMNVKQSVRSYQIKQGDNYFLEQISHSSFVELAWRIQTTSQGVTTYKGSYVDIEEGNFTSPVTTNYTLDEYANAWGKPMDDSMIYIISNQTVLDTSSYKIEGDTLKLSLDLHPIYSVLRYVKQMVKTSDLGREPSFHEVHLNMEIDKDMLLQVTDIKEVYDVQSFGITSKNTVGELHEVRYYNLEEKIPELNEKLNYNKEAK